MPTDAWIGADPPGASSAELWQKDGSGVVGSSPTIIVGPASANADAGGSGLLTPVVGSASATADAFGEVYIPFILTPVFSDAFYQYENVGFTLTASIEDVFYEYENVGFAFFIKDYWSGWGVPMSDDITSHDDWYYNYENVTT